LIQKGPEQTGFLIDYGLSKVPSMTDSSSFWGTSGYLPPERVSSSGIVFLGSDEGGVSPVVVQASIPERNYTKRWCESP
jgi:serine/threonine protein kinase